MKVIDLTHTISPDMTHDTGVITPTLHVTGSVSNGSIYQCTTINNLFCHIGTHLDCPTHMLPTGYTTDTQDVGFFIGKAVVIDIRHYPEGSEVGMEAIADYNLDGIEFVLFHDGWCRNFTDPVKFYGAYPVLSMALIEYFGKHKTVRGIGVESNSLDIAHDEKQLRHKRFLRYGTTIIECLNNLDLLLGKPFVFAAFPLKLKGAEGSPVRAVAILE